MVPSRENRFRFRRSTKGNWLYRGLRIAEGQTGLVVVEDSFGDNVLYHGKIQRAGAGWYILTDGEFSADKCQLERLEITIEIDAKMFWFLDENIQPIT